MFSKFMLITTLRDGIFEYGMVGGKVVLIFLLWTPATSI
jgi:hypothetical protein